MEKHGTEPKAWRTALSGVLEHGVWHAMPTEDKDTHVWGPDQKQGAFAKELPCFSGSSANLFKKKTCKMEIICLLISEFPIECYSNLVSKLLFCLCHIKFPKRFLGDFPN